ncbi:MAG: sigma-70 family RNA polymerase sigma factor [Planctomycetota bacterium]
MDSTSVSLLRRLRDPDEHAAWQRFVDLYAPLIFHWGRGQGFSRADAADLVQEVMTLLVRQLPQFEYSPKQRFRGWLRTVTVNKARDLRRRLATRPMENLEAPDAIVAADNDVDVFEEAEYRSYLVNRGLVMLQNEFPDHAWQACWKLVVDGKTGAQAARELGISENLVYVSKSRVLRRLREELSELMD